MSNWSKRAQDIDSFKVMELLARASELTEQGVDVIAMGAGEPDFATPPAICAKATEAIAQGLTKYTPSTGIKPLKEAISQFYQQRYQLDIAPERIVVTAGASAALLLGFSLIAAPGEQVLMTDPGYPCNKQFLRLIEASAKLIAVDGADNFQLSAQHIEQHWDQQSCGALVASPANPTGTMLTKQQLSDLSASIRARGGQLVVDEIYHGLTYDGDATSVLSVDDDAFVINSFSKYFGMTGWRLGWIVAPLNAVPALERLAQNLFISPPTIAQYGALAAFEAETIELLEQRRWIFKARRDLLIDGLTQLGFKLDVVPQGAFYVYVDASAMTMDSYQFCWQLLEQDGILITPGVDFGHNKSGHYLRFSYTTDIERIKEALHRLAQRLDKQITI